MITVFSVCDYERHPCDYVRLWIFCVYDRYPGIINSLHNENNVWNVCLWCVYHISHCVYSVFMKPENVCLWCVYRFLHGVYAVFTVYCIIDGIS